MRGGSGHISRAPFTLPHKAVVTLCASVSFLLPLCILLRVSELQRLDSCPVFVRQSLAVARRAWRSCPAIAGVPRRLLRAGEKNFWPKGLACQSRPRDPFSASVTLRVPGPPHRATTWLPLLFLFP